MYFYKIKKKDRKYFKMKKILVTGSTGFVESHLVDYLLKKKYKNFLYKKIPPLKIR